MEGFTITRFSDMVLEQALKYTPTEKLFGDYWLENQLGILFADSGTGKTIFAVDIAVAIAGGHCWWPGLNIPSASRPVGYVDMELSEMQAAKRYITGFEDLPENLYWIRPTRYEEGVSKFRQLELSIIELQGQPDAPKIFILDNLLSLCDNMSLACVKHVINSLKQMKEDYGLSILIVQHTHKIKPNKPLTMECLFGSKFQDVAADSIFALGSSILGNEVKYCKHLKARDGALVPGVATLSLETSPYMHLKFEEMSNEEEHLSSKVAASRSSITPDLAAKVVSLRSQGLTQRAIAEKLNLSKSAVGRGCIALGI